MINDILFQASNFWLAVHLSVWCTKSDLGLLGHVFCGKLLRLGFWNAVKWLLGPWTLGPPLGQVGIFEWVLTAAGWLTGRLPGVQKLSSTQL